MWRESVWIDVLCVVILIDVCVLLCCCVVAETGDVVRHRGPVEKEYSLQTTKNEEMFVTCKLDWTPSGQS
jgi:hypothetical protein